LLSVWLSVGGRAAARRNEKEKEQEPGEGGVLGRPPLKPPPEQSQV
jgi:hypothetical protein